MLDIKRIVVSEYDRVQEIEFYEGATPDEVVSFCNKWRIARNTFRDDLMPPKDDENQLCLTEVGGIHGLIDKNGKFNPL